MRLQNPVYIKFPSSSTSEGFRELKITTLDYTIRDNSKSRHCYVSITMFPKALVLWSGDDYTQIGDYTQSQVEAKIIELLGNDPASVLKTLLPSFAKI